MDTTPQNITETWLDIKTAFTPNLSVGTDYLIQNTSSGVIYLNESTSAPATTDSGHVIASRQTWTVTVSSKGMYIRTQSGDGEITVTEA